MGQILMAGAVMFFWGRMLINSFSHKSSPIKPMPTVDLVIRALTPTATPWTVLEPMRSSTMAVTSTQGQIIPTQTPWVITATPEPTPEITPTPWYENMVIPSVPGIAVKPDREHDLTVIARLSYYYPPYAYLDPAYEINCDKNSDGSLECEHMASGEKVFDYVGEACACPPEYPFGTVFQIMDGFYTCRDRGGAIQRVDENLIWLDMLYPYMPGYVNWGYETEVKIWLP